MTLDLSRKSGISDPERWEIASDLHAIMLDEIFLATKWTAAEGIFHGGTSLHLVADSPRLSEDLDFMVAEPSLDHLASVAPRIVSRARLRVLEGLPGSILEFSARDRGPGPDRLVTWDVRWKHPMRMGKVQVKLEFYAVEPECLLDYKSRPELRLPGLERIRLTVEIPVPELVSAWGDKIKAVATRPEFKWRDAYDIGFISRIFDRSGRPSQEALREALLASARIYGKTEADVAEGLQRRLEDGTLDNLSGFVANMVNWFPLDTFKSAERNGTFADMLSRARHEIELGHSITSHPKTGHGL